MCERRGRLLFRILLTQRGDRVVWYLYSTYNDSCESCLDELFYSEMCSGKRKFEYESRPMRLHANCNAWSRNRNFTYMYGYM